MDVGVDRPCQCERRLHEAVAACLEAAEAGGAPALGLAHMPNRSPSALESGC